VSSSPEEGIETWNPTAAYLVPFLLGVAVQLVGGLFSVGPELLYPTQGLVVGAALWACRRSYGLRPLTWSWMAIPIGTAGFLVYLGFASLLGRSGVLLEPNLRLGGSAGVTAAVFTATAFSWGIIVPLAEEIAFRGYLQRMVISENFTEVSPSTLGFGSFLISSLAFGVLQSSWIAGTLVGMLYAFAQYRRGRLQDAFLSHAVTNLLALGYSYWLAG
jgi:CAAX prenyl protease-like protein